MAEPIAEYGNEVGLCGHDGSVWIKVKVDADGHLQVDGVSTALPTGAATATNQSTMITALQLIDDLRNALGSVNTDDLQVDVKTSGLPTDAATATNQATLLTELQAKLETADLNLDGTKDLQVDVKTTGNPSNLDIAISALRDAICNNAPVGSALSDLDGQLGYIVTAVELIDDLRNALGSVATDSLLARLYGWDGAVARKLGLLFGYYDRYQERVVEFPALVGTRSLDTTVVPAGYVYIIQSIAAYNTVSVNTRTALAARTSAAESWLACVISPAVWQVVSYQGALVLKEGDFIRGYFYGTTAGDEILLDVWGYKMQVDQ